MLLGGALGFATPLPNAHAADPADAFDAEAQRVLQQPELQRLPAIQRGQRPSGDAEFAPVERRADGPGEPVSGAASSFAQLVGWVLLGVLAFLLLGALLRAYRERRTLAQDGSAPSGAGPAPGRRVAEGAEGRPWLAYANSGRYSDAVHSLLLNALAGVAEATRAGRALTSREVLAVARLAPEQRAALEEIVRTVERSLFGGAELGPADYQRCQKAFELFGSAERRA